MEVPLDFKLVFAKTENLTFQTEISPLGGIFLFNETFYVCGIDLLEGSQAYFHVVDILKRL